MDMYENRNQAQRPAAKVAPQAGPADAGHEDIGRTLRTMGACAHQLGATIRAADHYLAEPLAADRETASWLMSSAITLAEDLALELDGVARMLKQHAADSPTQQRVAAMRVRCHQLHAAAKAADHYLDGDAADERETGSWLVSAALGLAVRLIAQFNDVPSVVRKATTGSQPIEPHDPVLVRQVTSVISPRGVG
jgi:hypothetical protein